MNLLGFALGIILAGGVVPFFGSRNATAGRLVAVTALAGGSLAGLGFAVHLLAATHSRSYSWNWIAGLALSLHVDRLAAFFLLPLFLVTLAAALYSFHYLDASLSARRTAVHYLFFSLLTICMALVVCAGDMITFVLAWEGMSIASAALVLSDYQQAATRRAGYRYLLFTQGGGLFLIAAFALLYAGSGSFGLTQVGTLPEGLRLAVFLLGLAGFGSKAGVFPLHTWLPHAHPAAPSHISALMSGVMIKMGIYGLVRLYFLLQPAPPLYGEIVLVLGALSGVVGVVYALAQHDLKRLLAYHSVENIGIILLGLGVGMVGASKREPLVATLGFSGALFHVFNHALFKSLLFLGAGSVLHGTSTTAIDRLGGLMKPMRKTGIAFLVGAVAISGLPPLNGFASEFLIYNGGFAGSHWVGEDFLLLVLALVSLAVIGGLACACFAKVVGIVFLGEPRQPDLLPAHDSGVAMQVAMYLLVCLCLVFGLLPNLLVRPLAGMAGEMLQLGVGEPGTINALGDSITMAGLLVLAGTLLLTGGRKLLSRGRAPAENSTWGCGFSRPTSRLQYSGHSFAASIIDFYRLITFPREEVTGLDSAFPSRPARYHAASIDLAEQAGDRAVAAPLRWLLGRLRWIQHGHIQLYIAYIVLAIALLLLSL